MDSIEKTNDNAAYKPWGMEEKQFIMFMHLSQLTSLITPGAGIILPIVMWVTNKEQSQLIDTHGKNITNWMISSFIYGIISGILIFAFIGIPMLFALGICSIVFAVIGGIKANEGTIYKYPLTISFIK